MCAGTAGRQLAKEGFAVVINYANSASEATALVAELREAGHQAIAVQANVVYVNGEALDEPYLTAERNDDGFSMEAMTLGEDEYFVMGDNRDRSADGRYWGFVPETHIVGKPLFIWFSTKYANMSNGIRWDRIFTSANK